MSDNLVESYTKLNKAYQKLKDEYKNVCEDRDIYQEENGNAADIINGQSYEIEILNKALELAIGHIEYVVKDGKVINDLFGRKDKEIKDYFIEEAKKELENGK